ncbi:MAG: S9 family peptidase [Chloroflexi bacterium]|nr:S9 family peptidase [Chloroflexota bacterium]
MHDRTAALIETFASTTFPTEYTLSPDKTCVAFTADVGGHSQIFVMPIGSSRWPKQVTAGFGNSSDSRWSPDSRRLVYVRDDALWLVDAAGTGARELTDHPAGNTDPRWSPDGTRIAFFSRRRGWEQVWTIGSDGSGLLRVSEHECDSVDPVWSPDSQSLVYCAVREEDLMTRGVYIVPSTGGEERLLSPRGCWSGAPHFAPDGRTLAYLSDQDGWFHVYLQDLQSGRTRQLTHGPVEDGGPFFYSVDPHGGPVYSPDGSQIAFIRHRDGKFDVWIVDVSTGEDRRVSRLDGHFRIVDWVDTKTLAVTFGSPARPPDLMLLSTDGNAVRQLTDLSAGGLRGDVAVSPEWVTYPVRDGLTIHAALLRQRQEPGPDAQAGVAARRPALVFLHGGPNFEFAEYFYPLPQILASDGYVVLAPNFRGSTGYGTQFRHANFREWGHADAFDVVDGARWLAAQPYVDPERIAVIGPSYGGYLTLCALTLAPELFCAGVDLYGDSEIAESYRHGDRYGRMDLRRQMGTPEENPEGYHRGSPLYLAERIQSPLLILHGQDDMLVVPLMSDKMIEALKIENKYYESHFYEHEAHGLEVPENRKDAWERIIVFLNRHCKGEREKEK